MDNSVRIEKFYIVKEACKRKLYDNVPEKNESFLEILKKLEAKYENVKGACQVLYDFYKGEDVEDSLITSSLEIIKTA